MAPVLERRAQRVADQERAEARAVDKQIAFDGLARFEDHRIDVAALALAADLGDLALAPDNSRLLREFGEPCGIEPGIELEGIIIRLARIVRLGRFEPPRPCGDNRQRIVADRCCLARCPCTRPTIDEARLPDLFAIGAEGVDVAITDPAPIAEFDTQFDGRGGARHHLAFVESQQAVEGPDLRERRLAHPDRADGSGFDQRDRQAQPPEQTGQRDRGHPARRPAADDHYPVDLLRSRGHAQAITSVAKTDNCAG